MAKIYRFAPTLREWNGFDQYHRNLVGFMVHQYCFVLKEDGAARIVKINGSEAKPSILTSKIVESKRCTRDGINYLVLTSRNGTIYRFEEY